MLFSPNFHQIVNGRS